MSTSITADQREVLQTDHAGIVSVEREGQQALQFNVVPVLDANGIAIYRSTTAVPSDDMDDLQMATWEDAEWQ